MYRLGLTPFRASVAPRSGLLPALAMSFLWAFLAVPVPEVWVAGSWLLPPALRVFASSLQVSALDWRFVFEGARGTSRRVWQSRSPTRQQAAPQANASFLRGSGLRGPVARDRQLPDR